MPTLAPATYPAPILRACQRVAPLWNPDNLVAVNPFVGYADEPLLAAAERIRRCLGLAILPAANHVRQAWATGAFTPQDLATAAAELHFDPTAAARVAAWLDGAPGEPLDGPRSLTVAERCAAAGAGAWPDLVAKLVSGVLADRLEGGVSRWPGSHETLWAAWQTWASRDRTPEIHGLPGFCSFVDSLPTDPTVALLELLLRLEVPETQHDDYLTALFGLLPGWAGRLREAAWHGDGIGELPQLAAVLLAYEVALAFQLPALPTSVRRPALPPPATPGRGIQDRLLILTAAEAGFRRQVLSNLVRPPVAPAVRPAAQVAWCIDVRSEPLRRALEASDPGIETLGFAGFFAAGVALDGSARCPVLLQPNARVGMATTAPGRSLSKRLLGHLRRSGVGGFVAMETAGFLAFPALVRETLGHGRPGEEGDVAVTARPELSSPLDLTSLDGATRLAMASSLLKHLAIATPARLLVLCGHDASVANNPQAAGLTCGACGGHGGGLNARIAAAVLNEPAVRTELARRGQGLPADTIAVAAVHDTVTDVITVLDRAAVPASHAADLARLEQALARAGAQAGTVRAAGFGEHDLVRRARDWAEARPEWALAGNAGFIAARRCRSAGLDLGGRVFLNSYDEAADLDGATLELILTAPVVVASWINLQYFASAVDPEHFGSGRKTIHNPIPGSGVIAGNHGDLAVGLAFESVHDGTQVRHVPQRLQVVVEAATERIDAVVARHNGLRNLVHNGWIVLIALDPAGGGWQRWQPDQGWTTEATPAPDPNPSQPRAQPGAEPRTG
jgi:uncharacterized protein